MSVEVTVVVPDEILNADSDAAPREVVERFALEGFKTGQLTAAQVRRLLGFDSRIEVYDFLAAHGIAWVDYDEEEIDSEYTLLKRLVPYC